jgi:hypothetical protein
MLSRMFDVAAGPGGSSPPLTLWKVETRLSRARLKGARADTSLLLSDNLSLLTTSGGWLRLDDDDDVDSAGRLLMSDSLRCLLDPVLSNARRISSPARAPALRLGRGGSPLLSSSSSSSPSLPPAGALLSPSSP